MGRSSLISQFNYALSRISLIEEENRESVYKKLADTDDVPDSIGKRDFKQIGANKQIIISIGSMHSIQEKIRPLADFLKKEYNVKMANQVTREMVKDYSDRQISSGNWNSIATINANMNAFDKLSIACGVAFRSNDFYGKMLKDYKPILKEMNAEKIDKPPVRAYSNSQIESIINYIKDNPGLHGADYGLIIDIQSKLGLRVSEISQVSGDRIHLDNAGTYQHRKFGEINKSWTVEIHGKGGLVSFKPIPQEDRQFFRDWKEMGLSLNVNRNNYGKKIADTANRLGFEVDKGSTSTHEIRKYYASNLFEKNLSLEGYTVEDIKSIVRSGDIPERFYQVAGVSVYNLGHSHSRKDLIDIYVFSAYR